jgi:hypothetical protein
MAGILPRAPLFAVTLEYARKENPMNAHPSTLQSACRRTATVIVSAGLLGALVACGGGGYGGGGNVAISGVGPSKLFAADSINETVGSLATPNPASGMLTPDRKLGGSVYPLSNSMGSLALDATRDVLYVGLGTSVRIYPGASMANGDIFIYSSLGSFISTGSMFVDTTHNLLYVGDDASGVKVFSGASTISGAPTPRVISGDFGTTFQIHGVAVDTTLKDILYVSNTNHTASTDQISVFDAAGTVSGSNTPDRTITPTISGTAQTVGGIYVDAMHDVLYVAGGSASTQVMVFIGASTANNVAGVVIPTRVMTGFASGILSVTVDIVNDRLYAIGSDGNLYIVSGASTANGAVSPTVVTPTTGGSLTAVAVNGS